MSGCFCDGLGLPSGVAESGEEVGLAVAVIAHDLAKDVSCSHEVFEGLHQTCCLDDEFTDISHTNKSEISVMRVDGGVCPLALKPLAIFREPLGEVHGILSAFEVIGGIWIAEVHGLHEGIEAALGRLTLDGSATCAAKHGLNRVIALGPLLNPLHIGQSDLLSGCDTAADELCLEPNLG